MTSLTKALQNLTNASSLRPSWMVQVYPVEVALGVGWVKSNAMLVKGIVVMSKEIKVCLEQMESNQGV